MKRNIDLTLKRDFNGVKDETFFEAISRSLQLRIHGNKETPWRTNLRLINNDFELKTSETSYDDVLITGNKTKRTETKFCRKANENTCACCGRQLDYIPWKQKYGLCDKCDTIHCNKLDKVIWKNEINLSQDLKRVCWR